MKEIFFTETHARLRTWLALGYVLFIVYASLSPFSGWKEQGIGFGEVLAAPFSLTYTAFDSVLNLISYLPFGLLAGLALRARLGATASVVLAVLLGFSLSAAMEYLQMYLPMRISSNTDLLANTLGALAGALLAASITSWGWLYGGLTRWRSGLFLHGKEMDFGLALLVLWMFGQINPSLPMLGNVFISATPGQPFIELPPAPFDPWESGAVALNLLMLGTLLLTLLRVPRNVASALLLVLSMVALTKFITAALLLKSWALLLWLNGEAMAGILLGMLLLFAASWLPRAYILALGAVAAVGHFAIANLAPWQNAPESSASIYHWHYGHLLNYNGLAQTIALAFPLLLLWHLWRVRNV